MSILSFAIFAFLYTISCAIVDGLINRLIFRENRKLSYFSPRKQKIYRLPEWTYIGTIFLIFIGIVAPAVAAYTIGGFKYLWLLLAIASLTSWDIIFGKMVFDDWFGDLPNIKLPFFGWLHVPLIFTLLIRLLFSSIFFYLFQTTPF